MIKQFNFYDIYGYLLPGMLLLGLLWLPVGILTQAWPDQDISKALFVAVMAYIAGHILQTIANSAVPSTIPGPGMQPRFPSELFLDKSSSKLSSDFKIRLSGQVSKMFGLDLRVTEDGDGRSETSRNRQVAFFQARSYLIAKKSANYVEQFEGLYAMMRGLCCSFLAGAAYMAGWGLSFHRDIQCLARAIAILLAISIIAALVFSAFALSRKADTKKAVFRLALCLLLALFCSGFWVSAVSLKNSLHPLPAGAEFMLWAGALLALIAAARCFSSYRSFAEMFAMAVWRDFSAYMSFQSTPASLPGDGPDEK